MFALEFLSIPIGAPRVLIREKCVYTHITNFYIYTKNNLYENHLSIFVRESSMQRTVCTRIAPDVPSDGYRTEPEDYRYCS